MAQTKRLYRSREDQMIAGIAGGIGEYFEVDPVWVRLAFVLLAFAQGVGVVLYVVAWIIMPENPRQKKAVGKKSTAHQAAKTVQKNIKEGFSKDAVKEGKGAWLLGGIFVILGVYFLIGNVFPWMHWLDWDVLWPLLLVAVGVGLLMSRGKQ